MYRYPPPVQAWVPGAEMGYDIGHGPSPPPYFATPPPGYPIPPPVAGWGPCMGLPPRALPPRGFSPRPFPPRGLPPGVRPPPPRGMPRPLPPGGFPPPIGFPPGRGPPPIGFPPGTAPPPIGFPPRTVPPPTGLPFGAVPPPFGLTPRVPPPIGLPPAVPPGYPCVGIPPPRGFPPRPPLPSAAPPAGHQSPRGGFVPGPGNVATSPLNNYVNNGQTGRTNGQWSALKRNADDNFTKQQKQKRQKVDKRNLPENNAYFCEVCDRGFKTEDLYTNHVDSHEKCSVEGCQYVAHPKLVRLHYECQHRTGFAKKIWQMESKQDIDRWISERKAHYPTTENVEKKKRERFQKMKRGEVLENKVFGKLRGKGRGRGAHLQGRGGHKSQTVRCEMPSAENGETEEQAGEVVLADEAAVLTDLNRAPNNKDPLPWVSRPKGKNQGKKQKEPTLLEKLLAPDIRHERNVLLQYIRYVVEKFSLSQGDSN